MTTNFAFRYLSVSSAVFSTMCGLSGLYCMLFVLATCATYRNTEPQPPKVLLRRLNFTVFIFLLVHFVAQAIEFARSRDLSFVEQELHWSVPTMVVEGLTTATIGLISDGLFVWRFSSICGHLDIYLRLYAPTVMTLTNFCLAVAATLVPLWLYHDVDCALKVKVLSAQLMVAWGWSMLAMHTVLSVCIFMRVILCCKDYRTSGADFESGIQTYLQILRAIMESCAVTWIGLLTYNLMSIMPGGQITTNNDGVGFIMKRILPFFFGISQCLLTVRRGFPEAFPRSMPSSRRSSANATHFGHEQLELLTRINLEDQHLDYSPLAVPARTWASTSNRGSICSMLYAY